MISIPQWIALLLFYTLYLLFGAGVFLFTESQNETHNLKHLHKIQLRLSLAASFVSEADVKEEILSSLQLLEKAIGKDILAPSKYETILQNHAKQLEEQINATSSESFFGRGIEESLTILTSEYETTYEINMGIGPVEIIENITGLQFEKKIPSLTNRENLNKFEKFWDKIDLAESSVDGEKMWNLWNSFFFAFTDITTIGFGHLYPKTDEGQAFCLFYSIIGVPLNGIVFAGLADMFASKIMNRVDKKRYENKSRIILDVLMYLTPGVVGFFFVPAVLFSLIEGWTYLGSLYFTFITLSTIGFGDLVAGVSSSPEEWSWLYKGLIQLWIIFGLGYLLMILAFIQKALRSKQLRAFDRKIGKVLKRMGALPTKEKDLRNEVQKLACILKSIDTFNDQDKTDLGIDNISVSTTSTTPSQERSQNMTSFSPEVIERGKV